eukprot:3231724-Amphidinium_carterae.1
MTRAERRLQQAYIFGSQSGPLRTGLPNTWWPKNLDKPMFVQRSECLQASSVSNLPNSQCAKNLGPPETPPKKQPIK